MKYDKKQQIRKVLKYYTRFLMLKEYRVYSRFKTASEDAALKDTLAVINIDEGKKVLYLKLNRQLFNRMKIREIKRYILHELLHSFFGELSILFESVVRESGFSSRRSGALIRKFDDLEHRKINYLINLMSYLDRRGKNK